jgi:hypothetical protein
MLEAVFFNRNFIHNTCSKFGGSRNIFFQQNTLRVFSVSPPSPTPRLHHVTPGHTSFYETFVSFPAFSPSFPAFFLSFYQQQLSVIAFRCYSG